MLDIKIIPITFNVLGAAALIFCLRVADVSLGTLRLIMITHGCKELAGILFLKLQFGSLLVAVL